MSPEFSRPFAVGHLGEAEVIRDIEADAGEREALARRFGLVALESLKASLAIKRVQGGTAVRVRGEFAAAVVQSCVVTCEPVAAAVSESFEIYFAEAPVLEEGEVEVAYEGEDPPEAIVDGRIDLGEAVAEYLALGLDPYPRAEGVEGPGGESEQAGTVVCVPTHAGPFAVLEKLLRK